MKKTLLLFVLLCLFIKCEVVFEDDISNNSITILAPKNNSQLNSGAITFSWDFIEDVGNTYQIQIVTPNFTNANQILLDSITDLNRVTHGLDPGAYQWRVKAINSAYETPYSTVNFIVN